jgi:hypothetical protein
MNGIKLHQVYRSILSYKFKISNAYLKLKVFWPKINK